MGYVTVLFVILIVSNLIMVTFQPFQDDDLKISFSIWMKILPTWTGIPLILYMFYHLFIGGNSVVSIGLMIFFILFFLYLIYAAFQFTIMVIDDDFYWFNGMLVKSVNARDINKIHFHKGGPGKKVDKIVFLLEIEHITIRNDLGIEWMVRYLAKENDIKIEFK